MTTDLCNMATTDKLEELNLSQEELQKLTDAFKKEEFRKLFFEYAEEISNPENKARYESEIQQLENERGMDVKFVNPEAGYVMKTTIGGEVKAFINVCKNENVGKPSSEKKVGKDGQAGLSWTLPHSFAPPREDLDREKKKCQVFDFVVHPDTYRMAETNARFKKMISDLALDGIQKQFDVELDTKNVKFPKMKYKGAPTPTVIRTRLPDSSPVVKTDPLDIMSKFPYPYDNQTSEETAKQRQEEYDRKHSNKKKASETNNESKTQEEIKKHEVIEEADFTVPKYTIKHRSEIDFQDYTNDPDIRPKSTHPKALVVEVLLPLLSSAAPIQLDIYECQLKLVCTKPAKYKLKVTLPYAVDENQGSARFDKASRKLIVTLAVVSETVPQPLGDSEQGQLTSREQITTEGEEYETCMKMPNDLVNKPLIEVISSNDEQESHGDISVIEGNECNNSENMDAYHDTEYAAETKAHNIFNISYLLPPFECTQTSQTVHFVFRVFKVLSEKISLIPSSSREFQLKMVSVGEGGFPVHYSCCASFGDGCHIVTSDCRLEMMKDKVVLSLVKEGQAVGWWTSYLVGTDPSSQEVRQFVNVSDHIEDSSLLVQHELCNDGIQVVKCDSGNGVIDSQESHVIADSDTNPDADCHALSAVTNSSSTVVSEEVQQLEQSSSGTENMDDLVGTDGGQMTVESQAVGLAADSTVHVTDSDTTSAFNSETTCGGPESEDDSCISQDEDNAAEVASGESAKPLVEEISNGDSSESVTTDTQTANRQPSEDSRAEQTHPSSMLSWSDSPSSCPVSKTTCAVTFENSVMFDLDVE